MRPIIARRLGPAHSGSPNLQHQPLSVSAADTGLHDHFAHSSGMVLPHQLRWGPVRQAATLPHASSRPRLTTTPLRYAAYHHYDGPKQRCWAHLLRDIHDLVASTPRTPRWPSGPRQSIRTLSPILRPTTAHRSTPSYLPPFLADCPGHAVPAHKSHIKEALLCGRTGRGGQQPRRAQPASSGHQARCGGTRSEPDAGIHLRHLARPRFKSSRRLPSVAHFPPSLNCYDQGASRHPQFQPGTQRRPPGVRTSAFIARPPNLQHQPLTDTDFMTTCSLVRLVLPHIRFLSVRPRLCHTLPPDPASRRRPCASLTLLLRQDG